MTTKFKLHGYLSEEDTIELEEDRFGDENQIGLTAVERYRSFGKKKRRTVFTYLTKEDAFDIGSKLLEMAGQQVDHADDIEEYVEGLEIAIREVFTDTNAREQALLCLQQCRLWLEKAEDE